MKILSFLLIILYSLPVFADEQAKDLSRIEARLNGVTTITAPFVQEDSEGGKASGMFYLSRPGKLRWDYAPPTPILIVAKGSLVAYYDKELDEVSHVSLEDTMAGFLTRKNISFSENGIKVIDYKKKNGEILVTITQEEREEDGNISMVFNDKNLDLLRMEVFDSVGKTTRVYFSTIVYGKPLDNTLFNMPKTKGIRRG